MRMLRRLSLGASILTILTAFMGSYVRGRNAGLACPDWPLCYGQLVPEFDFYIFLEWGHRMMVFMLSLMILVITIQCWRKRLSERWLTIPIIILLLAQAILGGLTVLMKLDPIIVAMHQGMALTFFGTLVTLTVQLFNRPLNQPLIRA